MSWNQVKNDLATAYRHAVATLAEVDSVKRWRQRHPKFVAFARRRLSREEATGLRITLIAAALAYSTALFLDVAADYLGREPLFAADVRIAHLLYAMRSDGLLRFFYVMTTFASADVVIVLALGLAALLWFRRKKTLAAALWLALIVAEGAAFVLKLLFHRARPEAFLQAVSEGSFSFPSGHATTAAVFYGFIAYLAIRSSKSWKTRFLAGAAAVVAALLVDFSRLYLGVHYLSDVLAGSLIGLSGLLFAVGVAEWLIAGGAVERPAPFTRRELLTTCAAACAAAAAVAFVIAPLRLQHRSPAPPADIGAADPASLFESGRLPRYTETLVGRPQEPANVIIVAEERCLEPDMAAAGWILADSLTFSSTERAAKAALLNREYPTAPITPSFYDTFPNDYGFEKETARKTVRSRHHARFWRTGYAIEGADVLAGTASLDTGLKWGITHMIAPDIDTERDLLVADLRKAGLVAEERLIPFVPPTLGKNFAGEAFFTNGLAALLTLKPCP